MASQGVKSVPCSQGVKSAKKIQMGLFQITQEAHEFFNVICDLWIVTCEACGYQFYQEISDYNNSITIMLS